MECVLVAISRLVRADDGQDLIEYGLVAVLIAIGAMLAIGSLGTAVYNVLWQPIAQNI
jgi:Flp pilus assembly pilin Flp